MFINEWAPKFCQKGKSSTWFCIYISSSAFREWMSKSIFTCIIFALQNGWFKVDASSENSLLPAIKWN